MGNTFISSDNEAGEREEEEQRAESVRGGAGSIPDPDLDSGSIPPAERIKPSRSRVRVYSSTGFA